MSDNLHKRGPRDRNYVSLQYYERRDLCKLWGITQVNLREAVAAVGNRREDVKRWVLEKIQAA